MIDELERAAPAFWEPWHPRAGQRVRVLSRPECFYCREDGMKEVGATGTVWVVDPDPMKVGDEDRGPQARAHRVWVELDDKDLGCHGLQHFAAIELEPIEGGAP